MYQLKPIRSNKDHAAAMKEIDRLLRLGPPARGPDADRLETLTILVEAFERSHPDHRIEPTADPVAALTFHMERLGRAPKDLEAILQCSRSRVWEILNRKRALPLPQIRALVRELEIPPERLIDEYEVEEPRAHRQVAAKRRGT